MPLILGTNSIKDTGYDVANSLRFNSGSSDSLTRSISGTNTTKLSVSMWVKLANNSSDGNVLYASENNSGDYLFIHHNSDGKLDVNMQGTQNRRITNRVFKDASAWYNFLVVFDSTQASATDRIKIFVNGVQETSFATETNNMSQDSNLSPIDETLTYGVGAYPSQSSNFILDGYICEMVVVYGTALSPTDVGEFDEDSSIWKPKDVSGLTFGTNGFYLEYKQSGTSQNSSGMGADTSGNDNHFAVSNLTAEDQSIDTCTNNFATFNPLNPTATNFTITQGNLDVYRTGAFTGGLYGTTIMPSSGKWYVECKIYEHPSSDAGRVGIANYESIPGDMTMTMQSSSPSSVNGVEVSFGQGDNIMFCVNGSDSENNSFYTAFSNGDVIRMALDLDNGRLYFGVNGNWWNYSSSETGGDPTSGSGFLTNDSNLFDGKPITFYQAHSSGISRTSAIRWNFGSPPYSESGGNSDGNGYGNFNQAVPSGYYSLCTKNLAEYG